TTDIASFPLIWVAPLALYLVTFIVAFAHRPLVAPSWAAGRMPLGIAIAAFGFWSSAEAMWWSFAAQFTAFFFVALGCHSELAATRPHAARLTEFYFYLSLGGVIGGAFTALISPLAFANVVEYPSMLAVACLLRPRARAATTLARRMGEAIVLGAVILLVF